MKKLMLVVLTCLFFMPVSGQKSNQQTVKKQLKQSSHWQPYVPRSISAKQFIANKKYLGLSENNELKEIFKSTDKNGISKTKFKPTVCNVPVEGSIIITREKESQLIYTGHFVPGLNLNTDPTLNEEEALEKALASMQIKLASWENQAYEDLLKTVKNDPNASNYPKGELVIYDNNYSKKAENYNLAYKFQIYSIEPLSNKTVYVDAHNGNILGSMEKMHNCTETCNLKPATGSTNHHGTVNLEVCTDEEETYFLQHNLITAFTANNRNDLATNCIESEDSIFEENPTANEVYWASHQYYNFLLNTFDRKSIDDNDHALVAIVNYKENYINAHWNGSVGIFGDGDGQFFNSLTSLDIVAHEFTHGLIDYTANLIYQNESGALNESFADIFGILLEYYALGETDWQIGNQFTLQHNSLRNFVNPKGPGQYNGPFPNTYLGEHWIPNNGKDNGGVHFNSSVQNHWFYLLSEGDSGVNDNGYAYNVEGIGIENSAKIVYENLTNYLFPSAQFIDAREGAIQAAKDIFGEDSFEAEQTKLAWCAVGVGECQIFEPTCNRETDSLALISLYEATNGANWTNKWDLSKPMDTWYGVKLNEAGCVTHIDLDGEVNWTWSESEFGGNNLIGNIPAELGDLNFLYYLNLANNQLSGNIPPEIGNLYNLFGLDLHSNQLTNNIPAEIGNLNKLEWLLLYQNQLSGNIPPETGDLSSLFYVDLRSNKLNGSIPSELVKLNNLNNLAVANNLLGGCYAPDLNILCDQLESVNENISNGNNFDASWEDFCATGLGQCGIACNDKEILIEFYIATNGSNWNTPWDTTTLINTWHGINVNENDCVTHIELSDNGLTGELPSGLSRLNNLFKLDLSSNSLTGVIPNQIGNIGSLVHLSLRKNILTGEIPIELGNLINIETLSLSNNELTGEIPDELYMLKRLEKLFLSNNQLEGCYSEILLSLCSQLLNSTNNDISNGNNFAATWEDFCATDAGICSCNREVDSLALLALYHSTNGANWTNKWDLNKPMDTWYGVKLNEAGCVTHIDLDGEVNWTWSESEFGGNNLIGTIPAELGDLNFLYYLNLANNQLSGNIPTEIGNLHNLYGLDLHSNQLTSNIPAEIGNLNKLEWLLLYQNQLSGTIPPEIGDLSSLFYMDLRSNKLNGSIPPELVKLKNLNTLLVADNLLSGCYPPDLNILCDQLENSINENISDGNNFAASWEDFCVTGICDAQFTCNREVDSLALLAIYNSTNGANWTNKWDLSKPMDTWYGVKLNEAGCVTHIDLDGEVNWTWSENKFGGNNLIGNIPAELGDLNFLYYLNLANNQLSGNIPPEIGNLHNLYGLDLHSNQLTNNIPAEIGNLNKLEWLLLYLNQLSGNIPPEIGDLSSLISMDLISNKLNGSIPPELVKLNNLNTLLVADNLLSGCYPPDLNILCDQLENSINENISRGNNFAASWEDFCATDAGICSCNREADSLALIALYNSTNGPNWIIPWDLTQPMDTWYGVKLNEAGCVTHIDLDGEANWGWNEIKGNNLIGNIPPELGNLKQLTFLMLSGNQLSGRIPKELGGLYNLTTLELNFNNLTGSIPQELGNLTKLRHFALAFNNLSGSIPIQLENLQSLKYLGLSYNQLNGAIPSQLGNLSSLTGLGLGANKLEGNIPVELGNLSQLKQLGLFSNILSGSIPPELGNLSNLTMLDLPDNKLTGIIPPELGQLSKLTTLQLCCNELEGSIPTELSSLTNLTFLAVNYNKLSGCYDNELKNLCQQLTSPEFKGNTSISNGNNFDATWEDFCASAEGTCKDAFVLPGDFNADGCLSYTDVLIWGLAEGNTGPTRANASNGWTPQISTDWTSEVNGINSKHQDANGDGIVDIEDLIVFVNNFEIDSTRCNGAVADNAKIEQDYPDYISINPIESTEVNKELFEIFLHSKIDNIGLQMHGFEIQVILKGYQKDEIKNVTLDTSPFNGAVEVVDTLIQLDNGDYLYKAAVTKTDNINAKFDRNYAAAILIVTIDDLPPEIAREKQKQYKTSGSYLYASTNAIPLALQGTQMFINKEENVTINIVPSHGKGSLEVFVQTENGLNTFTIDDYSFAVGPSGIPSEHTFRVEIDDSSEGGLGVIISDDNGFTSGLILDVPPPPSIPLPLFPNPAIDQIQFDLAYVGHCERAIQKIDIFDVTGYLVQTVQPQQRGDCIYQIEVSHLPEGIYFVDVWTGDQQFHNKFIKQ